MTNFKTNLVKTIIDDGKANFSKDVSYVKISKEKPNNLNIKTNISNVKVNEAKRYVENSFIKVDNQVDVPLFKIKW